MHLYLQEFQAHHLKSNQYWHSPLQKHFDPAQPLGYKKQGKIYDAKANKSHILLGEDVKYGHSNSHEMMSGKKQETTTILPNFHNMQQASNTTCTREHVIKVILQLK